MYLFIYFTLNFVSARDWLKSHIYGHPWYIYTVSLYTYNFRSCFSSPPRSIPMTRNPVTNTAAMFVFGLLLYTRLRTIMYEKLYIYIYMFIHRYLLWILLLYNIIVYRRRASHSLWYNTFLHFEEWKIITP